MNSYHVNIMMRQYWIGCVLAALLLAGCTGSDSEGESTKTSGNTPVKSNELTKKDTDQALKDAETLTKAAIRNIVVSKPGTDDWELSEDSLGDLGYMLDEQFTNLINARCEGMITYSSPLGDLTAQVAADLKSVNEFNIDFFIPSEPGMLNKVISDGRRRARFVGQSWTVLASQSSSKSRTMDKDDVNMFMENFTQEMFSQHISDTMIWEPLFKALQDGVAGFKATVERKTANDLEYIRVYARSEEDGVTEMEVRIDELRMIPLAIRVVKTQEDGTKFKLMWTGSWAFGGRYDRNNFIIPATAFEA